MNAPITTDTAQIIAGTDYYEHISHLVFRYVDADDGACAICTRTDHPVHAGCYEVRTARHVTGEGEFYTGVTVCPECLAKHGADAGRMAIIAERNAIVTAPRDDFTPREREEWQAHADTWIPFAAFAETCQCVMPPILPVEWFPRSR